jgi:voltage-gated potassium channel
VSYEAFKDRVAIALDGVGSPLWRVVNGLIFVAIVASVTATVLATVPELDQRYGNVFDLVEIITVGMFSVELTVRVWSANSALSSVGKRRWSRGAYLLSPSGLIDLLSVAPFYLGATHLLVFRSLRLVRVFRVLKLTRQARAMQLLGQAIRARRDELFSLLTIVALALLISATVMYSAEHETQPKNFGSIPQSLWWAVATLTTVGYGDIYPQTAIGRVCASFIMILGIGLLALPTGLLGSAMYDQLTAKPCSRCGHDPKEIQKITASSMGTSESKMTDSKSREISDGQPHRPRS